MSVQCIGSDSVCQYSVLGVTVYVSTVYWE
jgi:hypothetical protein